MMSIQQTFAAVQLLLLLASFVLLVLTIRRGSRANRAMIVKSTFAVMGLAVICLVLTLLALGPSMITMLMPLGVTLAFCGSVLVIRPKE
jgi:hypothetical protein